MVETSNLIVGDNLTTFNGQSLQIDDIIVSEEDTKVYNFEVEEFHTYFVSGIGIWTHNCSKTTIKLANKINELTNPIWLNTKYNLVEFNGETKINKTKYNIGRRIIQMSDLDPDYISSNPLNKGKLTNLQLMSQGKSPFTSNDDIVELHHLIQKEPGDMVEIASKTHDKFDRELHGLVEDGNSFRNTEVLDKSYSNFRSQYWRSRAARVLVERSKK